MKIEPKHVCSHCGTEVPEGAEFCPGCKRRIRREERAGAQGEKDSTEPEPSGESGEGSVRSEAYVWAQAVLPALLALGFYFLKAEEAAEHLRRTLLLFGGLTALFGLMDTAELNRRLHQRGMRLSDELRFQLAFFPILGLWKRRMLPGMDRTAAYPHVHSILLLLFVFLISSGGKLGLLLYT